VIDIKSKKKIGLVLSGGGVKAAAFHVGVCLALQEKGFRFLGGTHEQVQDSSNASHPYAIRSYVGSSAGALIASILASGHKIEDVIDSFQMGTGLIRPRTQKSKLPPLKYWHIFSPNRSAFWAMVPSVMNFNRKSLITGGIEALLKSKFKVNGLFTTKGVEKYLRQNILPTNSFHDLGVELYIVATQLNHTRKGIFGPYKEFRKDPQVSYIPYAPISDSVAASASLPPVFAPYPLFDQRKQSTIYYFDGEIRETLSSHIAADHGADLVLASYSVQPYHYTPEVGSLSDYGIPLIINQALYQVIEQKIESAIKHDKQLRTIVETVQDYFHQAGLPEEHREKLVDVIVKKVNLKLNTDTIFIHPNPQNYEMFFVDHFSLSPAILGRITKIGFKSALAALRKYDM